jgi:hypothetical protein
MRLGFGPRIGFAEAARHSVTATSAIASTRPFVVRPMGPKARFNSRGAWVFE